MTIPEGICGQTVYGTTGGSYGDPPPNSITALVNQRKQVNGDFYDTGSVVQQIKTAMQHSRNWYRLNGMAREGLEMIVHKIGRILSGDPSNPDHWIDIQGYAKCVEERLETRGVVDTTINIPQISAPNNQQSAELHTPGGVAVLSYEVLWEEQRHTVVKHRLREGVFEVYLLRIALWVRQSECKRV